MMAATSSREDNTMDILFLLKPDFMDNGAGPYYCPSCATLEGLLSFYSPLRQRLDVRYVDFPRPRAAVVELIGDANQGLPALVLGDQVPARLLEGLDVQASNGRRFLKSTGDMGKYLARAYGIGEPH